MPPTAPWTPALEPALLAICALLALLFVVLLRPVTPPTPLALFLCIMSLQLFLYAHDPTAISPPAVWTHALAANNKKSGIRMNLPGRTRWFWLHILLAHFCLSLHHERCTSQAI